MRESIVEWKPRPRNRVFIKLSGGRFFTVPASEAHPLAAGATLSDKEIERLARIDQYFRGREKAVWLLAIRPRSRWEIKRALDKMGLPPAIRDGVIVDLEERCLIDDVRFASDYIRNQVELKHFGPHRLKFDLKKRGVGSSIIDNALAREVTGRSQEDSARDIVHKKLGSRKPDAKDVRRLSALLRRKGLDYEVINHVMYDLLQESKRDTDNDDEQAE